MSFMSSEPTQLDLSWEMFRIPIRVSPWFWLTAVFLGWGWQRLGFQYLLVWVACVFVSILIHEMGHVLVGRLFGSDGHILLYSFGGLAIGSNDLPWRWQRIAVCLAGPGAQFVLLGVTYLVERLFIQHLFASGNILLLMALVMLGQINLYWPLLNLLPIWPLDGGQVSRELCQHFNRRNGIWLSLGISFVVSAALAVNALAAKLVPDWPIFPWFAGCDYFMVFFFALFAVQSWFELQQLQPRNRGWEQYKEERAPWEQDPDAWKRGQ